MYCLYCHVCGNAEHFNVNLKNEKMSHYVNYRNKCTFNEVITDLPYTTSLDDLYATPVPSSHRHTSQEGNKLDRLFFIKENMHVCLPRRPRIQYCGFCK